MRDFRDAKAMAQTLRDAFKVKSIPLTHSESLELIAKTLGVHDWNVLAAAIQSSQPMPAEPRKSTDGDPAIVPLVPLRDIVVFPQMVMPLFVGREKTRLAAEAALAGDGRIFAVTQRRAADDEPGLTDLYTVGVIAKVIHRVSLGDGTVKLIISGTERGTVVKPVAAGFMAAEVAPVLQIGADSTPESIALARRVLDAYEAHANVPPIPLQGYLTAPGILADAIAPLLQLPSIGIESRQQLLEINDAMKRLEMILEWMEADRQAA
jgi:ATP-dependent Lon protease